MPEWPDLGFPFFDHYSPCVLANLCLLGHGEAIGLPAPIYNLRIRLFELSSSSSPSSASIDPLCSFHSCLGMMREEVACRRSLSIVSSAALRAQDWRVGSLDPSADYCFGKLPSCDAFSRRGTSPPSVDRLARSVAADVSPYVPASPPSSRRSRSRSRSPVASSTVYLSGHLMSSLSRSHSPRRCEFHLSLDSLGRLVFAPPLGVEGSESEVSDEQFDRPLAYVAENID